MGRKDKRGRPYDLDFSGRDGYGQKALLTVSENVAETWANLVDEPKPLCDVNHPAGQRRRGRTYRS